MIERKEAGADRLSFKAALAVDEAGTVTGLASIFGTPDRGGDIVHKGAFAGASVPLPMLASHDPADVVGVWDELAETSEGLAVKGRLLVGDVVRASEVRALILAGAMPGLSIGYVATKKAPRSGGGRDLFKVELVEVSIVAVPMHPGAKVTSVKAQAGGKDGKPMEAEEIETKIAAAVAAAVAPYVAQVAQLEAKALRPAIEGGTVEPTPERKAFAAYLQRGDLAPETERKLLSLSSDPNGGYLAPAEFSSEVIKDIVEISPIRSLASVKGTNAPSVIYPTRKPMGNATWDDETTPEPETTTTNIFGQLEIIGKGMSTFVDIPNVMLQDAPMVEAEVREAAAEDFEKKETLAFIKGDGVMQPEGLMVNADIPQYLNGHATVLQSDSLIKMLYSIPPSYRSKGAWAMNGTTLGLLRTVKDGQGNYIWRPGLTEGQPETILGRPVAEIIDMDDVAANAFPILYGDFSGYRIIDRLALSVLVDPYSQATLKRTRYHMGRRVGGRVLQAIKFKKLKMA
ncbi:phage major capsid protein [Gemmobacter aquarius]|uniref:Phage major capsid protein n=1 Tax=Paragemmobacter aquarius TaxID=2169400 RepID=A0A2S0UM56_9RHOB|nr:phage major capsid protein [Gemmobacter aquarius]AWB48892.1 phage major capsid protein [Gemmobacter aquarius]